MGLPKGYPLGKANNPAGDDAPHATAPGQSAKGHFLEGNPGTLPGVPGRKKRRSRKLFTAKVMQDLWEDWRENGKDAIRECREKDVSTYVRAAISLLPKDINVNVNPIEQMPDDRLLDYIRGLEESIVAAIAAASGTVGGTESRAGETVIDAETGEISTLQETVGISRGGLH